MVFYLYQYYGGNSAVRRIFPKYFYLLSQMRLILSIDGFPRVSFSSFTYPGLLK